MSPFIAGFKAVFGDDSTNEFNVKQGASSFQMRIFIHKATDDSPEMLKASIYHGDHGCTLPYGSIASEIRDHIATMISERRKNAKVADLIIPVSTYATAPMAKYQPSAQTETKPWLKPVRQQTKEVPKLDPALLDFISRSCSNYCG